MSAIGPRRLEQIIGPIGPRHLARRAVIRSAAAGCVLCALSACGPGVRTRMNDSYQLVNEDDAVAADSATWDAVLRTVPLTEDRAAEDRVTAIASRLSLVTTGERQEWKIAVFEAHEAAAFSLAGGRIGITTGMLQVIKNDGQLAAVIGHEMGHVVHRHARGRAQIELMQEFAGRTARMVKGTIGPKRIGAYEDVYDGIRAAFTVLFHIPFVLEQEAEAEGHAILAMTRAGYDPREAERLRRALAERRMQILQKWLVCHPGLQRGPAAARQG